MDRNWKVYDEPPQRRKGRIYMTLGKRCDLTINSVGYEALGRPEAVFLMYSESTDSIAIEKADPRMDNAFPLLLKNASGTYTVHIKPLCDRHQIKYDCSVRFLDIAVEDAKLVASLLKTRPVPKRKRRQADR